MLTAPDAGRPLEISVHLTDCAAIRGVHLEHHGDVVEERWRWEQASVLARSAAGRPTRPSRVRRSTWSGSLRSSGTLTSMTKPGFAMGRDVAEAGGLGLPAGCLLSSGVVGCAGAIDLVHVLLGQSGDGLDDG
ncbi:hypothetical protein ACIQGZ_20730 [Streptomyces sp. NPDC092296]|uniref:hypothetical protein n=1 Tax=Streptomyces sp. NPDC092296 TaxID=3366012 RepID=UPI0037FC03D3